jgi:RimJ/RimL family protein N-acetyltransferase
MRLRPLTRADLEIVRLLRNQNRDAFFDAREIAADRQIAWFETLPPTSAFFVIEEDHRVVGTISVKEQPDGREVGNLLLDPAYRGRGLMRQAVEQVTARPARYFTEVKPDNRPSLNVFRAAGFSEEAAPGKIILRKVVG